MARIAIVSENDGVWGLSAWESTLPLLAQEGHEVVGLWTVESKLGRYRGAGIFEWYVRRLGVVTFAMLAGFAVLHKLARWRGGRPRSLQALAAGAKVAFFETKTPNDAAFVAWLGERGVDILLISVGHILKKEVLQAVKVGVINKHAGLVPANKGLWPYVWAVIKGMPQGVSYHAVTEAVDAGPLLLQHKAPAEHCGSMIAFYVYVYRLFGQHMTKAVENLLQQQFLSQDKGAEAAAFPLPEAKDFEDFYQRGGVVMRLEDIRLAQALAGLA